MNDINQIFNIKPIFHAYHKANLVMRFCVFMYVEFNLLIFCKGFQYLHQEQEDSVMFLYFNSFSDLASKL